MNAREIELGSEELIYLAQDTDQWRAYAGAIMKFRIH
jgi:hypothetical protein